jgi:hypothetical protein
LVAALDNGRKGAEGDHVVGKQRPRTRVIHCVDAFLHVDQKGPGNLVQSVSRVIGHHYRQRTVRGCRAGQGRLAIANLLAEDERLEERVPELPLGSNDSSIMRKSGMGS